jgi:hypothetical protein
VPERRQEYGAVILSLARQQWPDTSGYTDPEIAHRIHKEYHAGFVLKSSSQQRIQHLLDDYGRRFQQDFAASMPARESLR